MGLNAAAIAILVDRGLSAADILAVAQALEIRNDPTATERKRRQREKEAAEDQEASLRDMSQRDVTRDTPSLDKSAPQTPQKIKPIPSPPFSPPASRRGTRLADDFEPPEDWIAWAMQRRGWSRAAAVEECENFARYWQSKAGREAVKLDWTKTWQNWVVNSRRSNRAEAYDPDRITV